MAMGGVTAPPAPALVKSYCDAFNLTTLYDNPESAFIQSFALTGRLQADMAFFSASEGDYEDYNALLWRRFRFGAKMGFLNDFLVHVEADVDLNDQDPLYNRLTDAYLGWSTFGDAY